MQLDPKEEAIKHLEYNAERPHLVIPEYGRYMQKLVDLAVATPDREKRNKFARYIISIMGSMNPHLRDVPDFQHKLWDQLFIMSDFQLDVDSPFPIPSKEILSSRPEKLPYPQNFPKYRFYGNNIKYMIDVANRWEDGDKKVALIKVIANHMKKSYLTWNKDSVEDKVIFEHLYELSGGKINLTEELSNSSDLMRVSKKTSNKQTPQKSNNNNNNKNKNHKQKQK
jgi:hypothetical protein